MCQSVWLVQKSMKSGPTKREIIIVGVLSSCQKVGLLFRTPKLRRFFKMIFLVFGAFHFPFKIPCNKTSKSYFFRLWRRDQVLEQVLGQGRAEMIWEWAEKSWAEVRRADKSWEGLRWAEKMWEALRRCEKRRTHSSLQQHFHLQTQLLSRVQKAAGVPSWP